MAVIFKERLKIQQFLLFLFFLLIVITLFIIGRDFFIKKGEVSEVIPTPKVFRKIEIDFELLKSPQLKELQPIEKIPPLETGIGRENPFLPPSP